MQMRIILMKAMMVGFTFEAKNSEDVYFDFFVDFVG
jgi:hypothetical protein